MRSFDVHRCIDVCSSEISLLLYSNKNCLQLRFHSDGRLDLKTYCVEYTRRLEANGRLQLIIWPDHCILGTKGHNVVPCVQAKMSQWVKANGKSVEVR